MNFKQFLKEMPMQLTSELDQMIHEHMKEAANFVYFIF